MKIFPRPIGRNAQAILFLAACAALAGCASVRPVAYSGLTSSTKLQPNRDDRSGRVPFSYSEKVDWRRYRQVIIEPVAIYAGPDAQFDKVSAEQRTLLARYMEEQFGEKLGAAFEVVEKPGPDTLRVQLTLTGAKPTTRVVGTLAHFDLAGGLYNGVQAIRGQEAALTGSIIYVVELFDGRTDRLLAAQVIKQYPGAMNLKASFGAMGAAKSAVRKGAEDLVEQLTMPAGSRARDVPEAADRSRSAL